MPIDVDQLHEEIQRVLDEAATGRGHRRHRHHHLTAYQILERLPAESKSVLVGEYGAPGRGAGKSFTAASRVAQIARDIAEYDYLDARGLEFNIDDSHAVTSGYPVIGIYRTKRSPEL